MPCRFQDDVTQIDLKMCCCSITKRKKHVKTCWNSGRQGFCNRLRVFLFPRVEFDTATHRYFLLRTVNYLKKVQKLEFDENEVKVLAGQVKDDMRSISQRPIDSKTMTPSQTPVSPSALSSSDEDMPDLQV